MKKIEILNKETLEELKLNLKKSKDSDQKNRIRAIINIKKGIPKQEVAKDFGVSVVTVIYWVSSYNKGGVDSLLMSKGGRPEGNPKWDTSIFENLTKEIDKGGYWSIPRMREWIKEKYDKDIPEQTVWYRIDQLNYSYKGSRPHPMQGNKERQESFKKGGLSRFWSR